MKEIRMNLWQTQIALLNKIMIGFELWLANPLPNVSVEQVLAENMEVRRAYLTQDVKIESYRMFVINYLSALLGMRKNDKISIYNNQPKGKEELIADYYKNNIEFIEKLTTMRDKVCSHFDLDFIDMCKTISIGEIGDAIEFLSKAIKE